ncbi:UNVERIFIED_CONTAM: ribosomal protein S18 acetylase RimI-like enzyme [Brevibacillus sp. OAP136]
METIHYRIMEQKELERIGEIDRKEEWTFKYVYKDGELQKEPVHYQITRWDEQQVAEHSDMLLPLLQEGGSMVGAFAGEMLVGVAVLGNRLLGEKQDLLQMAFLYVSHAFRRQGIAQRLMDNMCELAVARGAAGLYISATESGSAVGFYLDYGCELAERVDPELFAKEPADIHLILRFA